MSIEAQARFPSTPFGRAEINLTLFTHFPFRSSERSRRRFLLQSYKHLTPCGVKTKVALPPR